MGKPKTTPDDLITTAEAAGILGLSERQVRQHAFSGALPGRRLNPRTWVFRRGDVKAFKPRPVGKPPKKEK